MNNKKLNILFLFSRHSESKSDSTLTKDISDEFSKQGHNVKVATILEAKYKKETQLKKENGYPVLRIKTGNYFNTAGKIEKGITILIAPLQLEKAIKKYFGTEKIDLIYTHTPFVSNPTLIQNLKKHFNCKAVLQLWDIFPQNAVDIEMLKSKLMIKFFERQEQKMYDVFDYIGCMSEGNKEHMKTRDKNYNSEKYFLLKNYAILKNEINVDKDFIRKKYGYNVEDFICIFGGNMGKPQKLENILELAKRSLEDKKIKFLFIGKGTERNKLEKQSKDEEIKNIKFIDYMPREEYEVVTKVCDVGIVSLDERFTVPNFPSKTTDYFKLGLPILASLDKCAQNDYGVWLEKEVKAGLYSQAGNSEELYKKLLMLKNNVEYKNELSKNARRYYEEELGAEKAYKAIMSKISF